MFKNFTEDGRCGGMRQEHAIPDPGFQVKGGGIVVIIPGNCPLTAKNRSLIQPMKQTAKSKNNPFTAWDIYLLESCLSRYPN
jgi:hypothetical protein